MKIISGLLLQFVLLIFSSSVSAYDFYIFPVKEIEGFDLKGKSSDARPLVDKQVVSLFTVEAQKKIQESFISKLSTVYAGSIVNPMQVGDAIKSQYQYMQGNVQCGDGFVAPVNRSYAVVVGVTRASYYTVDKGTNIEILVPITLNVQLVKPDRAKIVYTASSTQYTPFLISKNELGTPEVTALMTKALTTNTITQLSELVEIIKNNFQPKDTPVKFVNKVQDLWVVDKGYEAGFKVGEELEARPSNNKEAGSIILKVMSVDSGYSVLKAIYGAPTVGTEYIFVIESAADDAKKPKLMPVSSINNKWSSGVADLFTKDIGFKAPFQITPVDVNFNDTMRSIKSLASCAAWEKIPSAQTIFDSREDHPNFFLRFDMSQSPVFTQMSNGNVRSKESFATILTAQVVDKNGNVIFSEMGKDTYNLEKVGSQGLNILNAKEISLKNSLVDLMKNFLQNVKLEPRDFVISEVQKGKFIVKGFDVPAGQDVTYDVVHPLGVKFNAKEVSMTLKFDKGADLPVSNAGSTTFSYSASDPDYPEIKKGDLIRVITMPKGNIPELSSCGTVYKGANSIPSDYLLPLINHVAYKSQNYIVQFSNPDFYEDVNRQLYSGFFKYRLAKFQPTEFCFEPGYLVKKLDGACNADLCNTNMLTALKIVIKKNDVVAKEFSIGEQTSLEGFSEKETLNLIGYRSVLSASVLTNELSKRVNK